MRRDLVVNGATHLVDISPTDLLLDVLRDQLGLTGTKHACGVGECGACTVLVDGQPRLACITLAARVRAEVTTIEGLADDASGLRRRFADEGAMQCGFCTPGQIVTAHHVVTEAVEQQTTPTQDHVRSSMTGNVCRCTGYAGIVRAITAEIEERSS